MKQGTGSQVESGWVYLTDLGEAHFFGAFDPGTISICGRARLGSVGEGEMKPDHGKECPGCRTQAICGEAL